MGRTCNVDGAKFKLVIDDKPKRGLITWEEVQQKLDELSPSKTGILDPFDADKRIKENKKSPFFPHASLKQVIEFLTSIYDEYGDLPFHVYNEETGCYYDRHPSHFNIVTKYHLIGCNESHQIMHIRNNKALILKV